MTLDVRLPPDDLATELLGEAAGITADRIAARLPQWWKTLGEPIAFTILGQPCSKANSRIPAKRGKGENQRIIWIKSVEALAYERKALLQIPLGARVRLQGPVAMSVRIWYADERSDLDESLLLDVLQDRWSKKSDGVQKTLLQAGVYRNDRQVRERHVYHAIDAENPRADVVIQPLVAQQTPLF